MLPTHINLQSDAIGQKNPIRYRGYYYDGETGFYYLGNRYYDAVNCRFINVDSAIGANRDITAYNLFVYCGNNPVNRYDVGGMLWKELFQGVKNFVSEVLHNGNNIAVSIGIDTAAIGAVFLNMSKDSKGVYHANFDCWQQYFGYNDLYDFFFDMGTSMATAKFGFSYNGTNYMIWAWKEDYINLGAGAEIGIYYGNEPHWLVDKSLAQPMAMWLSYKGENIITYTNGGDQWWCTGFNPAYLNVSASDLTATFSIRFTNPGMFNAFRDVWDGKSGWACRMLQGFGIASVTF